MAPSENWRNESAEAQQDRIPVIDLAGIDGPERQKICQQIADACESWGFFQLVNHGIDESLIKRVKEVSTEFFHGSEEEKLKVKPAQFGGMRDGWHHAKYVSEGNALKQKTGDIVEHLFFACFPEQQVPGHPAAYKSTLVAYIKELKFLGEKLFGLLSEMLGLPSEAIQTALIGDSSSQALKVRFRSNFYGLNKDGEACPGVLDAHSDSGGITILLADDAPGLEVKKDGQWVKVDPIRGGFIINIADMTEVCSNGRYKSVEHRARPAHKQERLAIAAFLGPPDDAVIAPITALVDETHPPLYQTSKFDTYIQGIFKTGLTGKNLSRKATNLRQCPISQH